MVDDARGSEAKRASKSTKESVTTASRRRDDDDDEENEKESPIEAVLLNDEAD